MERNIIIPVIVLILLILVDSVKQSNNDDLIKENCKSQEQLANINNAKKVFRRTKTSFVLLMLSILSLIICILCDFTSIDAAVIDYLSTDFYKEQAFDRIFYFLPVYIFIAREILIQVKIGEFLLKFFNVEEPILEENLLKTLLYKKKPKEEIKFTKKPEETSKQEEQIPETEKDSGTNS